MQRIRSQNTKPELLVRRLLHRLGYRFRLHARDLPGRPDIVFRTRRKVIFVHGCFWHMHSACREGRVPKTRSSYWTEKLTRNVERDADHMRAFDELGWGVLVLWECELQATEELAERLSTFLN